jgi:2-oxoglutarate ferredoxin oxidoreductase subunit beta
VFYREERATYDDLINSQVNRAKEVLGDGDLDKLLRGKNTWTIA